jgi:DoxX
MPFAFFLGWSTILIEVVGGLLILCGAFVPLASAPMIVVLLVAIFTVHLPNGFSSIKLTAYDGSGPHFGQPGYETDLLYLALFWRYASEALDRSRWMAMSARAGLFVGTRKRNLPPGATASKDRAPHPVAEERLALATKRGSVVAGPGGGTLMTLEEEH